MAEEEVPQVTTSTSQETVVTEVPKPATTETPENLGVDQASFDKYYKDGEFDWGSYGKEQAFKAKQAAEAAARKPAEEAPKTPEGAQEAVESAGLNWDTLGEKISANGDISPEDYKALADIGIPEHVVQDYVTMVNNEAAMTIDEVMDSFGGPEAFDQVFDALASKPLEQRQALDDLLVNPETRAEGVRRSYELAGLTPPNTPAQPVAGARNTAPVTPQVQGYGSFEEQVQAMRDPRYRTDPTYRAEVLQKVASSSYQMNPRMAGAGL